MGAFTSLKNHFVIAMPSLMDPNFERCVIYICEHTPEGAMGLIVNYPLNLHLTDILDSMDIESKNRSFEDFIILAGGPLQQERGFVLHTPSADEWESSLQLNHDVTITTSKDILHAMASAKGPKKAVIALGYAAWEAGQLEKEISENAWLLSPISSKILFELPYDERWKAAAQLVGVDVDHLSSDIGHA